MSTPIGRSPLLRGFPEPRMAPPEPRLDKPLNVAGPKEGAPDRIPYSAHLTLATQLAEPGYGDTQLPRCIPG